MTLKPYHHHGFLSQPQALRKSMFTTQTLVGYAHIRQNKQETLTQRQRLSQPFYLPIRQGIVNILLRHFALKGERCETLLMDHYAALVAKRCMAEEEAEARGDAQDPSKVPVRMIRAVGDDDKAAVVAWLDGGGEVDALWDEPDGSSQGNTLLMHASCLGQELFVDLLLDRKASIDLQNSLTDTALMCAAAHNKAVIIRLLLKAGGHIGLRNGHSGKTAPRIAEDKGHTACVAVFREHVQAVAEQDAGTNQRQR
jgi:hypothetical protein